MEVPIKANFREGLSVLEFFSSSHGTRKGLADTALRTADSGYLTRRLVDVSQDVIVRSLDCGTEDYVILKEIKDGNAVLEPLEERIVGRTAAEDIINPETGEIIVAKGEIMSEDIANAIVKAGLNEVKARSVLTCCAKVGICAKCYGTNLALGKLVNVGEAVGIIAAQSIGEPGTQLTMRTFHTGGAASGDDITQGLPRVTELFEARKPKGVAIISEIAGKVHIDETKKPREITVTNDDDDRVYAIPFNSRIKVTEDEIINAGDPLTDGPINPHDLLEIVGSDAVYAYIVKEVQKVYRMTGVDINDKHIEIIVHQMMKKVRIEEPGDTSFLAGSLYDYLEVKRENDRVTDEGGKAAEYVQELLGITKASLATDSFLSAASFQETTRVLTEAAIKGKVDPLVGLKENVIIGKLIPAGTGIEKYHEVDVRPVGSNLITDKSGDVLTMEEVNEMLDINNEE